MTRLRAAGRSGFTATGTTIDVGETAFPSPLLVCVAGRYMSDLLGEHLTFDSIVMWNPGEGEMGSNELGADITP